MKTDSQITIARSFWLPLALLAMPVIAAAQVPVDEDGQPIGDYEAVTPSGSAGAVDDATIPLLSQSELDELVGPIALYPDDLLAIVLPASTYPLQLVQAAGFLEDLESNPELKPDEAWDDSVVALVNYPEVVELLNDDLDWTWRLGEAVVAQQAAVIDSIESFRDRAYAAGNLKSDDRQTVVRNDDVIEITPVEDDVIYVPYYEPERVVVYQPRPVYHYYPRSYPVYYYPYSSYHSFNSGFFWGVTTAFTVGWYTDRLHVHHHSYRGHPYYGHNYWNNWWYRRPSINIHHNYYGHKYKNHYDYYRHGDYWRPQTRRTLNSNHRVTRSRYYPGSTGQERRSSRSTQRPANNAAASRRPGNSATLRRPSDSTAQTRGNATTRRNLSGAKANDRIKFRQRKETDNQANVRASINRELSDRRSTSRSSNSRPSTNRNTTNRNSSNRGTANRNVSQRNSEDRRPDISFRSRDDSALNRKQSSSDRRNITPKLSSNRPTSKRSPSVQPKLSRQSTIRDSRPRKQSATPNRRVAEQSPRRQSTARRSPSRQPSVRQSQPRQSFARQSQPRASAPKPAKSSKSGSSDRKIAGNSGRRSDRQSSRRR